MATIARRTKPEPRSRRITHWTDRAFRMFLAYAEYMNESDDPDYVLMALVDVGINDDPEFAKWLTAHPKAGEVATKQKRQPKAKKSAEKAAA